MAYDNLFVGMALKHFKSGRRGMVMDWGDWNGTQKVYLYFWDKEPADKNASRRECYEWRRLCAWIGLHEPLVVDKPFDPEGDNYAAVMEQTKKGRSERAGPPKIPRTPTQPTAPKAAADTLTLDASDDFSMVDETPKEFSIPCIQQRMLNELATRKRKMSSQE